MKTHHGKLIQKQNNRKFVKYHLGKPSIEKTRYNLEIFQIGERGGSEDRQFQKKPVKLFPPDFQGGGGS